MAYYICYEVYYTFIPKTVNSYTIHNVWLNLVVHVLRTGNTIYFGNYIIYKWVMSFFITAAIIILWKINSVNLRGYTYLPKFTSRECTLVIRYNNIS